MENLNEYLSLRQFSAGAGWVNRLETSINGYIQRGTIITPADIEIARQYCKGEIIEHQLSGPDDWMLAIQPFEDVRFLFKYTHNDEFGSALNFYIHQRARGQVATEDLAFLLDFYLQILGQRNLLFTLISIPPERHVSIHLFPKMEISIEEIERIYFALHTILRELNTKTKLDRAAAFTRATLQEELGVESIHRTLMVTPTLNITLRFLFSINELSLIGITASDTLVYFPSNITLYLFASYANAFARSVGVQYRVDFFGLCHYFHVNKLE